MWVEKGLMRILCRLYPVSLTLKPIGIRCSIILENNYRNRFFPGGTKIKGEIKSIQFPRFQALCGLRIGGLELQR